MMFLNHSFLVVVVVVVVWFYYGCGGGLLWLCVRNGCGCVIDRLVMDKCGLNVYG